MEDAPSDSESCFHQRMTISDDPRLPGLTTADTRWLVGEAQRVLADLGHSTTVVDGVALK